MVVLQILLITREMGMFGLFGFNLERLFFSSPILIAITVYSLHVIEVLLSFKKSKCALDNSKISKQTIISTILGKFKRLL